MVLAQAFSSHREDKESALTNLVNVESKLEFAEEGLIEFSMSRVKFRDWWIYKDSDNNWAWSLKHFY